MTTPSVPDDVLKPACPICQRLFVDENALYQHGKSAHGKPARNKKAAPTQRPEREPSIGEQLADAMLAAACGEDVPEHIEFIFPDEIQHARKGF